jgi:putative effector of murein hydrolase
VNVCIIFLVFLVESVNTGIIGYGLCQTGCNAVAVACYAAAGFTFGTVTHGAGVPAVIVGCNAALGYCMTCCIAAGALSGPI